jgi:hypothetical protein
MRVDEAQDILLFFASPLARISAAIRDAIWFFRLVLRSKRFLLCHSCDAGGSTPGMRRVAYGLRRMRTSIGMIAIENAAWKDAQSGRAMWGCSQFRLYGGFAAGGLSLVWHDLS